MQRRRITRLFLIAVCSVLALMSAAPHRSIAQLAPPAQDPLVIAISSPIDTLDPHLSLDTRTAGFRREFYDGLFRWQGSPLRVAPWLAESYTASEDGRTFRFTLRKDAKFHDGRDVRASDVVYSTERILALKGGLAPVLGGLLAPGSTKLIDALTVEFNLNRASPLFLTLLPELSIVNAELLKANEINNDWGRNWLRANDAGSGSYSFKARTPAGGILATRFADHWNREWAEKPVEAVEWRTMLDQEARVASLLKGEVQVLQGTYLPSEVKRLREAKDVAVAMNDSPRMFIGVLHAGREPMKEAAYRKIMAQAFDMDWFISSSLAGDASKLAIPVPPQLGRPPEGVTAPKYDIAAAREALAKLKLPARELVIGAIAGEPQSERAALIMLDGLVKLGLPAHIVTEPWPVAAARMRDEKQMYDILFYWRGARYYDANNWIGEMFDCDLFGAGNASWYCNKDADRLIKEARGTADVHARRQGFEKAAALLVQDQAGLFVATMKRPIAYIKPLKGMQVSPVGEVIELRALSWPAPKGK